MYLSFVLKLKNIWFKSKTQMHDIIFCCHLFFRFKKKTTYFSYHEFSILQNNKIFRIRYVQKNFFFRRKEIIFVLNFFFV